MKMAEESGRPLQLFSLELLGTQGDEMLLFGLFQLLSRQLLRDYFQDAPQGKIDLHAEPRILRKYRNSIKLTSGL